MAGSSSKQCCSPIGMVCIASILLLIVNPLARAFSVSSRQQSSARGIQVLLHGPTAGARRFGLTLVPRAAQYYDDDEGDYEPRGNYRRGGGGRRDDWRSGRGGAQGGSDEHDYMRSPEDVVSPTDDVAAIDSLLGERLRSKLRRDFDTADSIRYTLEKDYGVTVWDKEKIWTTSSGGRRPGRGSGGRDRRGGGGRPGRQDRPPREERDFGPTGHDYLQVGEPLDPIHCPLTEDEINALLADRLRAKMSRDFDHADSVKAQLEDAGVFVHDGLKAWRADGETSFAGEGGGRREARSPGFSLVGGGGDLSAEVRAEVEALIAERSMMKKERQYDQADALRERLQAEFNVRVEDKLLQWWVNGDEYCEGAHSDPLPDESLRGIIKEKLAQRSEAKMNRDYGAADVLRDELYNEYSIYVDDKSKEWRHEAGGSSNNDGGFSTRTDYSSSERSSSGEKFQAPAVSSSSPGGIKEDDRPPAAAGDDGSLESLTLPQLKLKLREAGLSVTGNKAKLIAALANAAAPSAAAAEEEQQEEEAPAPPPSAFSLEEDPQEEDSEGGGGGLQAHPTMAKFALRAALVCSILMYTQAWQVPQVRSRLQSKSVVNPVSLNSLKKSPFSSPTENYLGSLRMSSSDDSEKKGLKALIPTKTERKKLLPLAGMLFCILFNYTILRDTKDVLVVTAPGSGAEIIPFLKTYVNLPISILLTIVYSQLTNVMSAANVFYTILGSFLGFFAAFPTLIYPFRDTLHPNALCDFLMEKLPIVFYPFISMLRNWTYAIFYTMAQIWGSMVLSLLFWGFSNEVTSVPEAKKYYPLFGLLANVALIFSGQYVRFVSDIRSKLPDGVDAWGVSLNYLMGAVVAMGGVIAGLYNHMQKNVLTDPECVPELRAKKKKEKVSMSLGESAKYLAGSPYIRYLAMLVIGYGMSINIVEVTWKGKLKEAFPDPNAYAAFMGNFSTATGTVTLVMMILGRFILEKFGWGVAALITPLTLAATGAGFFTLILGGDKFLPFFEKLGTTPLMAACIIGAAQNIASKSTKYSLFDPSKEMAYIPLDQEQKTKGKAAIDVIGNPLGKSGGSFIQQVLIATFGSLAASTPYLGAILFVVTGGWIFSAGKLAPLFEEAMKKKEAEDAAAAEA